MKDISLGLIVCINASLHQLLSLFLKWTEVGKDVYKLELLLSLFEGIMTW